jgi:hypothetical protein
MRTSLQLPAKSSYLKMLGPPLTCGNFKLELEISYEWIAKIAVQALHLVLDFTKKFSKQNAHNMVAIMLDLRSKGLQSISKFVGSIVAKNIVEQYGAKILILLLHKVFTALNQPRILRRKK